tara:strand:+ start:388 stop:1254 length:867 start_codon:yes stop_codon:yes gene_type:complete
MNPKYPIYIISKGRADSRLTVKSLETMDVPYRIVIEPQEYDDYAAVIDPKNILVLPFSNLGKGSIPARNWVWEHSIAEGHEKHWILDDNIQHFFRLTNNEKFRILSGACFRLCEDFTDRYSNVKMSGLNYAFMVPKNTKRPPYYLNTRVYSCILLSNDIDFRWRGLYNEDTDLSLRIMKAGLCTMLFNMMLCGKAATHTMKGGNTSEVYKLGSEDFDERRKFAQSLYDQHPEHVKITRKFGRWHHHIDYSVFDHQPILKPGLDIPKGDNNYGLKLVRLKATDEDSIDE